MAKTTGPTQADILLNETALLAARSQRILQSLLGPSTNGTTAGTEAELEAEDAEIFKPEPDELLGPGFPVSGDGDLLSGMQTVQSLQADQKLRKQMLGRNAKRPGSGVTRDGHTGNTAKANVNNPVKPRPATTNRSTESDEEDGRSSLGKTKRRKLGEMGMSEVEGEQDEQSKRVTFPGLRSTSKLPVLQEAKAKSGSYLDEILAERSKKEKKNKKRSRQHGDAKCHEMVKGFAGHQRPLRQNSHV